jgi:hypothetical protein
MGVFETVKNMDVFHGAYRDVFTAFSKIPIRPEPPTERG